MTSINLQKLRFSARNVLGCHRDFDSKPDSQASHEGQDRVSLQSDREAGISNTQLLTGATAAGTFLGGAAGLASNLMSAGDPGPAYSVKVFSGGGTPWNPEAHDYDISHHSRTSTVFTDGLGGALVGAGVGALVGVAAIGLRAAAGVRSETVAADAEGERKNIILGGAVGAAIGASAGAVSALTKGQLAPAGNFSIPANGRFPTPGVEGRPAGELVEYFMHQSPSEMLNRGAEPVKTVSVGPGLVTSMLGGGAVGLLSGVAGGIAFNTLSKAL